MSASRLSLATLAVRPALKARLMLSGPAGAGKTHTGLAIATVLAGDAGKILLIDTEKDSALTYAEEYTYQHLPWDAPYSPIELASTITEAGGTYDVIMVDSASHFWTKAGGTLDIADGKFGGWKTARPAQEDFVDAVLGCKAHVILCVRSKMEYVQETDPNTGRQRVTKLGLGPVQDATLEYEMNVAVEMDLEHRMSVTKSRTTVVPVGRYFHPGHAIDFAVDYAAWLGSGEQVEAPSTEEIMARVAGLPADVATDLKAKWSERGLPNVNRLTPHQAARVMSLIDQVILDHQAPADPAEDPRDAPEGG